MDPDTTLAELRETSTELQEILNSGDDPEEIEIRAQRMVELFDALDGWLQSGGFLPRAWQPRNRGVQIGSGNTQHNIF
jgi:hypothetical protein